MTHKKILLLAFSLSLSSIIMGMEAEKTTAEIELEQHAQSLSQNIYKLSSSEERAKYIPPLVNWLVQQRNATSDSEEWNSLVKKLENNITLREFDSGTNGGAIFFVCIPQGIKNAIIANASELKPNQNAEELTEKINNKINEFYTFDYSKCGFFG